MEVADASPQISKIRGMLVVLGGECGDVCWSRLMHGDVAQRHAIARDTQRQSSIHRDRAWYTETELDTQRQSLIHRDRA